MFVVNVQNNVHRLYLHFCENVPVYTVQLTPVSLSKTFHKMYDYSGRLSIGDYLQFSNGSMHNTIL